jgi:hypothetical protein
MAQFPPEKFLDFVTNYKVGNENQKEGMLEFAQAAFAKCPELFADEAQWVIDYRKPLTPPPTPAPSPSTPASTILKVPYFSQRDNYRDAYRTCFSSSCAMLLEYLKPGTLAGGKGDDKYLQRVFSIGDTTDSSVQVKALASFGVTATFTTTCTFAKLDSQLKAGKPLPIGILHHGPKNAPSGGGHWIVVIGKLDDTSAPGGAWYVVQDPWGEITDSTGTYDSTNGERLKYSKDLLRRRWTVEGDGSGYAILV